MSTDANPDLVYQLFGEVFDRENFALADQLLPADFQSYFPSNVGPMNRERFKQFIQAVHGAFPDMRHTIDEVLACGDRLVVRYTARGTHQGMYRGIPATGKPVVLTQISIFRVRGGQIVEEYGEANLSGLVEQLKA